MREKRNLKFFCRLGGGWNPAEGGHFKGARRPDARGPRLDHYEWHIAHKTEPCLRAMGEKELHDREARRAARAEPAPPEPAPPTELEEASLRALRPPPKVGVYVLVWPNGDVYVGEGQWSRPGNSHQYISEHGTPEQIYQWEVKGKEASRELERWLVSCFRIFGNPWGGALLNSKLNATSPSDLNVDTTARLFRQIFGAALQA